jgi:hypothetical protein
MIQSGLEKFGAHQKARQLFNLVERTSTDVSDCCSLSFDTRHSTLSPRPA